MFALAQAFISWSPMAAHTLPVQMGGLCGRPPVLVQFLAGCLSLSALGVMTYRLGLEPAAAFCIAAACQMVFEVGPRAAALLAAQMQAVVASRRRPSTEAADEMRWLQTVCSLQFEAVVDSVGELQLERPSSAAVAFARSTAKPAVLLPWLAGVSRALALMAPSAEAGSWKARCCDASAARVAVPLPARV